MRRRFDDDVVSRAISYIRAADVLIVGGTSLNVYPAAGLINYYLGNKLVLVNLSETPYDSYADLVIHEKDRRGVQSDMNRINILGIKYCDMDIAEAVEHSVRCIEQRGGGYVLAPDSSLRWPRAAAAALWRP